MSRARLYLRLGDRVYHADREEWGGGAVVEVMTSTITGGTCLVRVLFEDGVQRTFNNDLDHEMCCYFMGVKRDPIAGSAGSGRRPTTVRRERRWLIAD